MAKPVRHSDAGVVAGRIIDALDGRIRLGLPLGLGKANRIANALFERAASDASISLEIFTALTLEPPSWSSDMERRFVEPLNQRLFGNYEPLHYAAALRNGSLPNNIKVHEFFLLAGKWLHVPTAQQSYISANYTHAARYIFDHGVNVITQLVAKRSANDDTHLSLSCNTDITLDLLPMLRASNRKFLLVGEISSKLPFMGGEAALEASRFDHILDTPGHEPALFATPKEPVSLADHAIGIHAASLVKDGGTLQIGIGSLGDALTAALIMRQRDPKIFTETLHRLCHGKIPPQRETGGFEKGLYAASEMFVDGFAALYREDILKRKASDGAILHSGFFVGPEEFYAFLRDLPEDQRDLFQMRAISFVNELYGDEETKRRDRNDARFVNNAMMATLLGETISDGLDDGRIVSGVGGQYNFVAQSFALEGARSVITLNATRFAGGRRQSRICWNYAHTTIPRHLRDIFVTEYGIADLRGQSDGDCIAAMLAITDAEFQEALLHTAKKSGKIEPAFRLAAEARNSPDYIASALEPACDAGYCETFPFGTDLTDVERLLVPALSFLRHNTASARAMIGAIASAFAAKIEAGRDAEALERMGLSAPASIRERIYRRLLLWALEKSREPG